MKQLKFLFIVCALGSSLQAARQMELFLRGNKFFKEKNTQEALKEYQEITNKGPVIWYNIGVCQSLEKNYVQALVAFKRAQFGANGTLFNKIETPLKFVQEELSLPYDSAWLQFAQRCAAYCSLFWLQMLLLILWWTYAVFSWLTVPPLFQIRLGIVSLLIGVMALTGTVWWVQARNTGIVIEERSLFIGPNTEFHTAGSVSPLQTVVIEQETETWYKIKSLDSSGWLEKEAVEKIELLS